MINDEKTIFYGLSKWTHHFNDNFTCDFDSYSDFIWEFGKLPFPLHLGKYIIKIGKISTKIHEIGKIEAIFALGMIKNGQIE